MILDVSYALKAALIAEIPTIVTLINDAYAEQTDVTIAAPAEGRTLMGIRANILSRNASELPIICAGCYSSEGSTGTKSELGEIRMQVMIQVWLANRDEGALFEQAGMWADALSYFVSKHGNGLIKGLRAPNMPDVDISNSEWAGDNYYRQVVQVGGTFTLPYRRPS